MSVRQRRRHSLRGGAVALTLIAAILGSGAGAAKALGPPEISEAWAFSVFSSSARLSAKLNPGGLATAYHFDYITKAAYDANLSAAKEPFAGASRIPPVSDANIGSGTGVVTVLQLLSGLSPDTAYRYRLIAHNAAGTVETAPPLTFVTQSAGGASVLLDSRGWEMVSPIEKNGGQVDPPEALAAGGVLQATAQGGAVTYSSSASFAGGLGAPPASQYLGGRGAGGWSTENITTPLFSGSYDIQDGGAPYQLFSPDLARSLLLNGDHCRGEGSDCGVANPPLGGTDAPTGYQDYYLREGSGFTALLGAADAGFLSLDPAHFDLRLAGASLDLRHVVLSTCAALTANASEVPLGEGCDPDQANLYEWSQGGGLSLLNLLPGETQGTPGAVLAAQGGAISEDGSHVYFSDGGNLYLRAGGQTEQADEDAGGGGTFETASVNGSFVFFTKGGHLWRYEESAGHATDLTPSGGVVGVLGASAAGDYVYYQDAAGLKLWHTTTTTVAPGVEAAQASDFHPATGTARVSADGTHLLFVSKANLSGYDNTDLNTGNPDSQVYLYDANGAGSLTCVSCNPTFGRPIGPSSIPGAIANGAAPDSIRSYKPRVLSANGRRVFFDSEDALALTDSNHAPDAYEWEAQGEGSCTRSGGCIGLVSDGRTADGAAFADASAVGSDAFFLTAGSLVPGDPGSGDLYDARIGGGFPVPPPPILCEGDACQSLPPEPVDPTLTTLLAGPGNPGVRYPNGGKRCRKGFVKRRGKCVRHHRGGGRR